MYHTLHIQPFNIFNPIKIMSIYPQFCGYTSVSLQNNKKPVGHICKFETDSIRKVKNEKISQSNNVQLQSRTKPTPKANGNCTWTLCITLEQLSLTSVADKSYLLH